jgi:small conductance mechanosensitive channel
VSEFLQPADWMAVQAAVLLWTGRLCAALLVFWIGKWLVGKVADLLQRALDRAGRDPLLAGFVRNLVLGLGMAVVVIAALDLVGIPNASLLTALGAAGLAIGLALQGSLSNLASGVLLIVFRPFRTGDVVEVAGQSGSVEQVSLLFTVLRTGDNRQVTVPNSQVMGNPIVNNSAHDTRRIDLLVTIAHGSDPAHALDVAGEVLAGEPRLLPTPAPATQMQGITERGSELAIRVWVRSGDFGDVRSSLLLRLRAALEAAGIAMPGPPAPAR